MYSLQPQARRLYERLSCVQSEAKSPTRQGRVANSTLEASHREGHEWKSNQCSQIVVAFSAAM